MSEGPDASLDDTLPSGDFAKVDLAKDTAPGGKDTAPGLSKDTEPGTKDTVLATGEGRPTPVPEPVVERGTAIGRYTVLDKLGSGTMGLVVAAFDPSLDRKVAIKLVKADQAGSTIGRQRLQREAQAMAKLAHPNVVTVFEVGTYQDRVFLAMEYIAGKTLADWLVAEKPPVRGVIKAFLAAGEGLAAAHHAGIVHRDFKPQNVLVSADGRVRVADFGLAIAEKHDASEPVIAERTSSLDLAMTKTGAVLGTPAYMAPEQHRGKPADARADQFAFCVALYEALYGELPFEGNQYLVYSDNVCEGRVREAPKGSHVPARLRKAIVRGLAVDPAARWPSMDALLAELAHDPAVMRSRIAIAAGAAGLAAFAVGAFALTRSDPDPCEASAQPVDDVWTPVTQAQVQRSLLESRVPGAANASDHVSKLFAERAIQLHAARRDACLATNVRHDQSAQLLDRRMHCIDQIAAEARALRDVLAQPLDESSVHKSIAAVANLAPVSQCADTAALLANAPPTANQQVRERVDALSRDLDKAQALDDMGKYAAAQDITKRVLAEADTLGYAPLRARARFEDAFVNVDTGHFEAAIDELKTMSELAAEAKDQRLLARSWMLMYGVLGNKLNRIAEARTLEPTIAAAIVQAGNPTDLQGFYESTRALVELAAEDYPKSIAYFDSAEKKLSDAFGANSPRVAKILGNKSVALLDAGRQKDALASIDHALAISTELLGPEHPDIATQRYQKGTLLDEMGKPEEALAELAKSEAINKKSYTEENGELAETYVSQGVVLLELGRAKEALDRQERAVVLFEQHPADNASRLPIALLDLARTYQAMERNPDALKTYQRALDQATKLLGPDDTTVADILSNMGLLQYMTGDKQHAHDSWTHALQVREAKLGPDHPEVAKALGMLANESYDAKKYKDAITTLDRAIAILDKSDQAKLPPTPQMYFMRGLAKVQLDQPKDAIPDLTKARDLMIGNGDPALDQRFTLADTLWDAGSHDDAIHEMESTQSAAKTAGKDGEPMVKQVTQWLAKHPLKK